MDGELLSAVRRWCFDVALPFWAERGLDRIHGGPVESLTLDGAVAAHVDFKRTRVTCRQVYVFSHAEVLGWPGAREAADPLYAYLVDRVWQGADKGWPKILTREGAVKDATPDLYDYAFALFALGWRHRATRDPAALALAHATLDLIESRFRHPQGGFHHALPARPPREQNPHMHLTEAALVWIESAGDARFRALADELVALFATQIARIETGVLPEFFEEDWRPVAGEAGRRVEPGHQFEWAWILAQHQRLTGADNRAAVRALVEFAERHGVDPQSQITFNAVRDDGAPIDRGSRTWPNTERMKGWLGLGELSGDVDWAKVEGSTRALFARYLDPALPGCWIDAYDAEGRAAAPLIPTSTLYHLFLAFAEAMRLSEA